MHEFGPKPTTTAWSHTPSSEISSLSSSGYSPKSSRRGYNTICVVTPGGVQRHVPHCPNIKSYFFLHISHFFNSAMRQNQNLYFKKKCGFFLLLIIILKHFLPNINTQALFFLIIILKHFFLHHHVVEETTIKQNYVYKYILFVNK